ncbi:ATP-binding protein [Alysiella crassa]|uniref:UDP-N-acetylglucosamine kinase n=2 Tax=Alysiella crassa TaxID=153491 RepID=A0A376BUZ8_9NEIS|nr:ATP-binding protein [Alysiella crassa]UOP06312.1 ATP-binding protein [Alysiella crassa]SSY80817.1 Uncharacterised protein [Alysiella crassa]
MQKFILLRGHEGSGKSTFAAQQIAQFQRDYPHAHIVHLDNDHALTDEHGNYHFDFEQFSAAHKINQIRQAEAFALGKREPQRDILIINANPNQKAKTCYALIELAKAHGFVVEIYRLHNFFPNIHQVAEEDVLRGYARLNANPVDGEIHLPAVREMSAAQWAALAQLDTK